MLDVLGYVDVKAPMLSAHSVRVYTKNAGNSNHAVHV